MEYFNLIFLPLHFQGLFPASGKNTNLTIMKNNSVQILMLISDLELMFLLQSLVLLMPVKICNHFPEIQRSYCRTGASLNKICLEI